MVRRGSHLVALAGLLWLAACDGQSVDRPAPPPYDAHRFDAMEPGVLRGYLQLQDALANDRIDAARAAAGSLAGLAAGDLAPLAAAAVAAADLESLRAAFRPLSEALAQRPLSPGHAVAFCPMAFDYEGARWVQAEGAIANPYFGRAMLGCGVFEDAPPDASP